MTPYRRQHDVIPPNRSHDLNSSNLVREQNPESQRPASSVVSLVRLVWTAALPRGGRADVRKSTRRARHGHCRIDRYDLIKPSYHGNRSREDSILPPILYGRHAWAPCPSAIHPPVPTCAVQRA
eukprot:1187274-Prorocentrum_minimum.AAC.2